MSRELLDLILAGNNSEAADAFNAALSARIADKLDAVKAEIGGDVFEEGDSSYTKNLIGKYNRMRDNEASDDAERKKRNEKMIAKMRADKAKTRVAENLDFNEEDIVESYVLAKHGDVTVTRKKHKDGSSYTDVHHKRKGVLDRGAYDRDSDAFWFKDKKRGGERAFNDGKAIAKHYAKEHAELEGAGVSLDESKESLQKEIEQKKKEGKFRPYSKLSMRLNFKNKK